ncbi:MAG: hypothetical protein NT167_29605, partial [Verrucomicrobia bacterium]|nr:hypothetical protein [Verrucomicrobiota bacterium]
PFLQKVLLAPAFLKSFLISSRHLQTTDTWLRNSKPGFLPQRKRRVLLTLQSRHWYALTGMFSGTPDVGVPRTVSCEQNYQFWIGQQPKPQSCFCFSLHRFLSQRPHSITNREFSQAQCAMTFQNEKITH